MRLDLDSTAIKRIIEAKQRVEFPIWDMKITAQGPDLAVLIDALYGGKTVEHIETLVKFEDGRTGMVAADLRISDAKTFDRAAAAAVS